MALSWWLVGSRASITNLYCGANDFIGIHGMDTNGSTLQFRVESLEKIVQNAVLTKEYDLQIKMQKESSERMEQNLSQLLVQVSSLHEKVNSAELAAEKRDSEQKQALSSLQLRLFYSLLGLIGLVAVSMIVYYMTHIH